MELGRFKKGDCMLRVEEFREHSGDIDRSKRNPGFAHDRYRMLKSALHVGLDTREGFGYSQREVLFASGRKAQSFPEQEHVLWCVGEKPKRIHAFCEGQHSIE